MIVQGLSSAILMYLPLALSELFELQNLRFEKIEKEEEEFARNCQNKEFSEGDK